MEAYDFLAKYYDHFLLPEDSREMADWAERQLKRFGPETVKRLADLGCGTGDTTLELARRGYEVSGIDLSEGMLSRARDKRETEEEQVRQRLRLEQGDLTSYSFTEKQDACLCLMDTLNHIDPELRTDLAAHLAEQLVPGGLLLFDVLKLSFLRDVRGDETFFAEWPEESEKPDFSLVWSNRWDEEEELAVADFTFFCREGELYRREVDQVLEFSLEPEELEALFGGRFEILETEELEERRRYTLRLCDR